MSIADIIIIALVALATIFCVRRFWIAESQGECGDCPSNSACDHTRCAPVEDMLARAEQKLNS